MPCILFLFPLLVVYYVYKLETSIDTKIVSLPIFVFSMKLTKSVVSLIKDCCFCAIGWSNVSTNEGILSVGPSQPEMVGLSTGLVLLDFCKRVEYLYSRLIWSF